MVLFQNQTLYSQRSSLRQCYNNKSSKFMQYYFFNIIDI